MYFSTKKKIMKCQERSSSSTKILSLRNALGTRDEQNEALWRESRDQNWNLAVVSAP